MYLELSFAIPPSPEPAAPGNAVRNSNEIISIPILTTLDKFPSGIIAMTTHAMTIILTNLIFHHPFF